MIIDLRVASLFASNASHVEDKSHTQTLLQIDSDTSSELFDGDSASDSFGKILLVNSADSSFTHQKFSKDTKSRDRGSDQINCLLSKVITSIPSDLSTNLSQSESNISSSSYYGGECVMSSFSDVLGPPEPIQYVVHQVDDQTHRFDSRTFDDTSQLSSCTAEETEATEGITSGTLLRKSTDNHSSASISSYFVAAANYCNGSLSSASEHITGCTAQLPTAEKSSDEIEDWNSSVPWSMSERHQEELLLHENMDKCDVCEGTSSMDIGTDYMLVEKHSNESFFVFPIGVALSPLIQ